MTILWTQPANDDFLEIVEKIAVVQCAAAPSVARLILTAVGQLDQCAHLGEPGRSPNTRELAVSGLPYLVVYGVEEADPQTILIFRVLDEALFRPVVKD